MASHSCRLRARIVCPPDLHLRVNAELVDMFYTVHADPDEQTRPNGQLEISRNQRRNKSERGCTSRVNTQKLSNQRQINSSRARAPKLQGQNCLPA